MQPLAVWTGNVMAMYSPYKPASVSLCTIYISPGNFFIQMKKILSLLFDGATGARLHQ